MNEGQGFLRDASQGSLMSVACRVSGKSELLREQVSDPVKHASGAEPAEAPAGRQRSPGRARGCPVASEGGCPRGFALAFCRGGWRADPHERTPCEEGDGSHTRRLCVPLFCLSLCTPKELVVEAF